MRDPETVNGRLGQAACAREAVGQGAWAGRRAPAGAAGRGGNRRRRLARRVIILIHLKWMPKVGWGEIGMRAVGVGGVWMMR
jgi:hypothetical protein